MEGLKRRVVKWLFYLCAANVPTLIYIHYASIISHCLLYKGYIELGFSGVGPQNASGL